jgi:hypothetical protein
MVVTVKTNHLYFKAEASQRLFHHAFEARFKVYLKKNKNQDVPMKWQNFEDVFVLGFVYFKDSNLIIFEDKSEHWVV